MASSLVLKKFCSPSLLSRSLCPAVSAARPCSSRLFNTNAVREYESDVRDGRDGRDLDFDRRPDRRLLSPFGDLFSSFPARSTLSQILNMMDTFMDSPITSGVRRNWDARETDDGLHLRLEMPGFGKEDVKVSVERDTLVIKGEVKSEDDEGARRYTSRLDIPDKLYNTSDIKAEMKNGILKVFVPKIKEEERSDVLHVNVD